MRYATLMLIAIAGLLPGSENASLNNLPTNSWTRLSEDQEGARRNSSFRYVNDGKYFLLWGFMGHVTDQYGNPDQGWTGNKEYDIVTFDPRKGVWESQAPHEKEKEWRQNPPPMHECNSYQGIATGSARPQLKMREGVLRPDLNLVFDQVTYDTKRSRMIYFTGGRTFSYETRARKWSDAAPDTAAPPPVSGATLAYDPFNDEVVLAGGGHVAEAGPNGKIVGYTGTWLFQCDRSKWRRLSAGAEPPPRMCTRLVCDTKNKVLVMFGGDGQSHYLADTWVYDTRNRNWRMSKASGGPPARAGHFTVYDPGTGWVIIGGGYNRQNLTDMWAYDAAGDRWMKLKGEAPTGWHVAADIAPEESLIVLATADRKKGDTMGCNAIYPVRTTYAFKVAKSGLVDSAVKPMPQEALLKRPAEAATAGTKPDAKRRREQIERLNNLPANVWVLFANPGRAAPLRTWGACTFDSARGRIVYWGGEHCGYGGSDYDFYDVKENTWLSSPLAAEYPERAFDEGVSVAGVTFGGHPFTRHGRKVYAYDPVSKLVINTRTALLTAGYEPDVLRNVEPKNPSFGSGETFTRATYAKWTTWTFDDASERSEIICSGYPGLDLTVTTPHGVMAVDHYWDRVDNTENAVYLLDVAGREWKKLSGAGPRPRNLYEQTLLVYDSKRDQLILHGSGPRRDELWRFPLSSKAWEKIEPQFAPGTGGRAPECVREAVYLPKDDVMLTAGRPAGTREVGAIWAYHVGENRWYKVDLPLPPGKRANDLIGQNRAWAYDPEHNLVLMVLGDRPGDEGRAQVFALRYDHSRAKVVP